VRHGADSQRPRVTAARGSAEEAVSPRPWPRLGSRSSPADEYEREWRKRRKEEDRVIWSIFL